MITYAIVSIFQVEHLSSYNIKVNNEVIEISSTHVIDHALSNHLLKQNQELPSWLQ